ncbi:MAG TPA: aldo/keto reductase [Planctomycetota bacterium]|nr:aldo/keto reductase [Planctomycetota bacterium]HRR82286.1 aldo/keto reductase [Planctomycetota bacterium]HRT93185.1 aldo/keto reductase [Planctomycetota bacterium]
MQYRPVGNTGVRVSLLGIGTMRFKGRDNAVEMIRQAVKRGLNYIDIGAAYSYKSGDDNAEAWVGAAIQGLDRSKLVISAKAQPRKGEARVDRCLGIHTRDQMWQCIETSLRRAGVSYFDFYQFWDMSQAAHFEAACSGKDSPLIALREAREQGLVRHLGFTSHGGPDEIIQWLGRVPDFRFVTVYYNFTNRYVEEAISYAHDHNVGVAIMGPLYGGILVGHSSAFDDALVELRRMPVQEIAFRFLFSNPAISTVLSGMNELAHLEENAAIASGTAGLTPGQCERFVRAFQDFSKGEALCTGCRYCDNACPFELPIYKLMGTYQLSQIFGLPAGDEQLERLRSDGKLNVAACKACGKCTEKCPRHVPVAKRMQHLAELLKTV